MNSLRNMKGYGVSLSSPVSRTGISYLDILVLHCVLADGWARIHTVDVIDAAANGVNLDDTKTHGFDMEKAGFRA